MGTPRPVLRDNAALVSPPAPSAELSYGDGSRVDAANVMEVRTFRQYEAKKKGVPGSKNVLLAYYQQRAQ